MRKFNTNVEKYITFLILKNNLKIVSERTNCILKYDVVISIEKTLIYCCT